MNDLEKTLKDTEDTRIKSEKHITFIKSGAFFSFIKKIFIVSHAVFGAWFVIDAVIKGKTIVLVGFVVLGLFIYICTIFID